MSEKPKKVLRFGNYPEAKMVLGNVGSPAIIKPYGGGNTEISLKWVVITVRL